MQYYFKELPLRRFTLHGYRSKPITLMDVCKQISADILYFRTAQCIYDCVRFKKSNRSKKINPIQVYEIWGLLKYYIYFNVNSLISISKYSLLKVLFPA